MFNKDAYRPEKRKFRSFQAEHMYELNVFTSTFGHTCWHKGTKGSCPPPQIYSILFFSNSFIALTLRPTKVKVYVASSNDPLFNIATEEWLFREGSHSDQQTLYLWRNSPTVRMNAAAIHEDFFIGHGGHWSTQWTIYMTGCDRKTPESFQGMSSASNGAGQRCPCKKVLWWRSCISGE